MYPKLKTALNSATFRQSLITTGSVVLNGLLGAIFYFLLARKLGASEFGLFSLAVTTIGLLVSLFDLGTDQGIVKFVSLHRHDSSYFQYAKLGLDIKILVGLFFIILFTTSPGFISENIFNRPEMAVLLPLVGIGVLSHLIFSFSISLSQALQKYLIWGGLFISTNLLRLILIGILIFGGRLTGQSATLIYVLLPLLGFVVSATILDFKFIRVHGEFQLLREFFSFNKWVTGFIMLSALTSRLDVYFTARFLDLSKTGIYALALQMANILPQLTTAIGAVIAPKLASFKSVHQNQIYVKKVFWFSSLISLAVSGLLYSLSGIIFNWSGPEYITGQSALLILLLSMSVFLSMTPFRDSIIYYFSRPDVFFWVSWLQLFVVVAGCWWFIPKWQITGAAFTVLLSQLVLGMTTLVIYFRLSRDSHASTS